MPRRFYTPIELAEYLGTDAPDPPTTGVALFARERAGRTLPAFRGPSGMIFPLAAPIWAAKPCLFSAQGNGTTTSVINHGTSASGTAGTANVTGGGTAFTGTRRIRYTSGAAAGSGAGIRHNLSQFFQARGWFYVAQFGIATFQANMAMFCGMRGNAAAMGNVDPATLTDIAGFAFDATGGETTWRFMHNDASGTATEVDCGASFPANTSSTDWYEARIFAPPGGSTIGWSLENLTSGALAEGEATTNIPASGTTTGPQITANTRAGTVALVVDVGFQYVESDF